MENKNVSSRTEMKKKHYYYFVRNFLWPSIYRIQSTRIMNFYWP